MSMTFAPASGAVRPLHVVSVGGLADLTATLSGPAQDWLKAVSFTGAAGSLALIPGPDGRPEAAVLGLGEAGRRGRDRFAVARARALLPPGDWTLATALDPADRDEAALAASATLRQACAIRSQ